MIFFYSGSCGLGKGRTSVGDPETIFGTKANLMLSYYLIKNGQQDQHHRLPRILEAKEGRNESK